MDLLIKNQILRHLSKFTKNLSADKIHLSTLKGEGELSNLQLDEKVLTDLLDLPSWLVISKAVCNRVSIKIQWTKLKSQPICLFLDEVSVDVETCKDLRCSTNGNSVSEQSSSNKYGLAERIIDGMYVSVNSVVIKFKAEKFSASIQLSKLTVQSMTPTWEKPNDLRLTRVKDDIRGEVMIFKEAEYQTLRIEASALDKSLPSTPLRLIANQSKIRVTIKKKLRDCSIIASRLHLNLDDLLWVLTDSQLNAALIFSHSLQDLIAKSSLQSKEAASEKVKQTAKIVGAENATASAPSSQKSPTRTQLHLAKIFDRFDFCETSYHIHSSRIDLHLCDETFPDDSKLRRKVDGGALQVSLHKLCFDFYPYHLSGISRAHWLSVDEENMMAQEEWVKGRLQSFYTQAKRLESALAACKDVDTTNILQLEKIAQVCRLQLLESCVVFRLDNFSVFSVSSTAKHSAPRKFFYSQKKALKLPKDMCTIYAEYTDYYFPDDSHLPVPNSNFFLRVNPVCLCIDYLTVLWLNVFTRSLHQNVASQSDTHVHVDTKIHLLMPKFILPAEAHDPSELNRPKEVQFQVSQCIMSNVNDSNSNLGSYIELLESSLLFKEQQEFPLGFDGQLIRLPNDFKQHAAGIGQPYLWENLQSFGNCTTQIPPLKSDDSQDLPKNTNSCPAEQKTTGLISLHDTFKKDGQLDLWHIHVDQFWAEFMQAPFIRPTAFIEAVPVNIWLLQPIPQTIWDIGQEQTSATWHCILEIGGVLSLQLSHQQYLFLLRLSETLSSLSAELEDDTCYISKNSKATSFQLKVAASVVIKEIELQVICPPAVMMPSANSSLSISSDLTMEDNGSACGIDLCEASEVLGTTSQNHQEPMARWNRSYSDSQLSPVDGLTSNIESLHVHTASSSVLTTCSIPNGEEVPFNVPAKSDLYSNHQQRNNDSSLRSSLASFSKGFGSIGTKLKNLSKADNHPNTEEDWETFSVASSEDDDFLLHKFESKDECPAFVKKQYEDLDEDVLVDASAPYTHTALQAWNRDVVSIVSLQLSDLQLFAQTCKDDVAIAATINHIGICDLGNIKVDKLAEKTSRGLNEKHASNTLSSKPAMSARLFHGPKAEQFAATASDRGYIHAKVQELSLSVGLSSVTRMADFIDDEKITPSMPLLLEVFDSCFTIKDNSSSPSPDKPPMDFRISRLTLRRTEDGVLHVLGETLPGDECLDLKYHRQAGIQTTPSIENPPTAQTVVYLPIKPPSHCRLTEPLQPNKLQELEVENSSLRRQLERIGRLSSQSGGIGHDQLELLQRECEELRGRAEKSDKVAQENSLLKEELQHQMGAIARLHDERDSLFATIQLLQEELTASEAMRHKESLSSH